MSVNGKPNSSPNPSDHGWLEKILKLLTALGGGVGIVALLTYFLTPNNDNHNGPDGPLSHPSSNNGNHLLSVCPSEGKATCDNEVAVNRLVVRLQKTTENFDKKLIDVGDRDSRRNKLLDEMHRLMALGTKTEACISQELVLVRCLYEKAFIDVSQWNSSREMLWKALNDRLLAKVQSEEDARRALADIEQLNNQHAIDDTQLNATREALSKWLE